MRDHRQGCSISIVEYQPILRRHHGSLTGIPKQMIRPQYSFIPKSRKTVNVYICAYVVDIESTHIVKVSFCAEKKSYGGEGYCIANQDSPNARAAEGLTEFLEKAYNGFQRITRFRRKI